MKLKVCGLTQLNQIQELINLGVDFLGFIFYEKSPRFVLNHSSFDEIKSIQHQGKVGVFVNETVEKILEISEKAGLNLIQLHGDEDENFVFRLRQRLHLWHRSRLREVKVRQSGLLILVSCMIRL